LSIIDSLITDRISGYYNVSDLNRVEQAFEYLQTKMNGEYGFNLNLTIKTDWTSADNITESNIEAYRQNVATIRSAITVTNDTPETPSTMRFLTARRANDIEKILQAVEVLLDNISAAWFYSGEIYSGEV
jgi:flagellar basal body P-ring protein FlgI